MGRKSDVAVFRSQGESDAANAMDVGNLIDAMEGVPDAQLAARLATYVLDGGGAESIEEDGATAAEVRAWSEGWGQVAAREVVRARGLLAAEARHRLSKSEADALARRFLR